jgi:hypothetical protein
MRNKNQLEVSTWENGSLPSAVVAVYEVYTPHLATGIKVVGMELNISPPTGLK